MAFLYKGDNAAAWAQEFAARAPEIPFHLWPAAGEAADFDPAAVRFLAIWQPPADIPARFPKLEILFSVGAGVDQFDLAKLPPTLPLVRMVEPGLIDGMVEYVCFAVLGLHRDMPHYLSAREWRPLPVKTAAQRRVGVLGLGELGRAVLTRLATFGFDCAGWSRSRHEQPGVRCHAGADELPAFLAGCDILVCLLPLTAATRGMLDAQLFAALPAGAALVNVGRGGHLVEKDLLQALDDGHLSAAILDVCEPEPLPAGHAFWRHPRIWLTPHIASATQPASAVEAVLENLRRHARGEALVGLVDRSKGY